MLVSLDNIIKKRIYIKYFFTEVVKKYNSYIIKKKEKISAIRDSVIKIIIHFLFESIIFCNFFNFRPSRRTHCRLFRLSKSTNLITFL